MDAMAQFVSEGLNVPYVSTVVHENVRMNGGHCGVTEGSAGLTGPGGRIDPMLLEEFERNFPHSGVECVVRLENHCSGLFPGTERGRVSHRSVAVIVEEFVQTQEGSLEVVEASYQIVAVCHRVDQDLNRLIGNLIVQVAAP